MRSDVARMTPDQIWQRARRAAGLPPAVLSPLTGRSSVTRGAIYACLLAHPRRAWTVNGVLGAVPAESRPPSGTVRSTLYVLMNDHVMVRVPFQRVWTARLTPEGVRLLRGLLWQWGLNGLHPPAPRRPAGGGS